MLFHIPIEQRSMEPVEYFFHTSRHYNEADVFACPPAVLVTSQPLCMRRFTEEQSKFAIGDCHATTLISY
jgi:hypothetical protein